MKIYQADYTLSGIKQEQYPTDGRPEIALVGRSNVGKSSLINALLNRRNLARTSGQPGKTQTANFYSVNEQFYLVDLPGYGYARTSKVHRAQLGNIVRQYLQSRRELRLVLQVVDLRHPPTPLDLDMFNYLVELNLPFLVVANKVDKLKRSAVERHRTQVLANLPNLSPQQLSLFSAVTKQGAKELWEGVRLALSDQ